MKRITIALLLVAVCYTLVSSCHKHDYPHKKDCQLKSVDIDMSWVNGPHIGGQILAYSYNSKRLLDSITGILTPSQSQFAGIKVGSNSQGQPVSSTGYRTPRKLVYENGRVVRVDALGTDNLYHTLYTFTYDAQGRVIERVGEGTLRWEYEGASTNFVRKFEIYGVIPGTGQPEVSARHQYQYDTKLNPWNTWPNTKLVPFNQDIALNDIDEYEPIPENNITVHITDHSFRGFLRRSHEVYFTYQYDDVYPVKADMRHKIFNIFTNSVDSTKGVVLYTYDCNGKGRSF